MAVGHAGASDASAIARRLRDAADRGDVRDGLALSEQAAALARQAGDVRAQAAALRERARFLTWDGDLEAAIAACEEGRELLHGQDAEAEWTDLAVAQAFALTGLGLGEDALNMLSQAREVAHRTDDRALRYWVHNRTGLAYDSFGEHETAREFLNQALALSEAVDAQARWSIVTNLVNNAMVWVPVLRAAGDDERAAGLLAESLEHAADAVEHCRRAGRSYELSLSLGNLGAIQQLAGDPIAALVTLDEAHAVALRGGYRPLQMSARQHMPAALVDTGRSAEAIELLRRVLAESEELGELPVQVDVLHHLADLYEREGEYADALRCFRSFYAAEQELRNGRALTRARLMAHQVRLEQARIEVAHAQARSEQLLTDQRALMQQTLELKRDAHTDALTGLANRRYLDVALPAMAERAGALGTQLWIAILDLDHFKRVNDTFGHPVGDQVLSRVGEVLRRESRPEDLVARYGGEEFLLAMVNVDRATAFKVCERLRSRIAGQAWDDLAPGLGVTASVGFAVVTTSDSDTVRRADEQLYLAKAAGRNRTHPAPSDH